MYILYCICMWFNFFVSILGLFFKEDINVLCIIVYVDMYLLICMYS